MEAEADPLALWTVEEEAAEKRKSPLKNVWNRSMVAIGLSGGATPDRRKANEGGGSPSPKLRLRTYQRAKGLFSRSRVDLSPKNSPPPQPRLPMLDEEDAETRSNSSSRTC